MRPRGRRLVRLAQALARNCVLKEVEAWRSLPMNAFLTAFRIMRGEDWVMAAPGDVKALAQPCMIYILMMVPKLCQMNNSRNHLCQALSQAETPKTTWYVTFRCTTEPIPCSFLLSRVF